MPHYQAEDNQSRLQVKKKYSKREIVESIKSEASKHVPGKDTCWARLQIFTKTFLGHKSSDFCHYTKLSMVSKTPFSSGWLIDFLKMITLRQIAVFEACKSLVYYSNKPEIMLLVAQEYFHEYSSAHTMGGIVKRFYKWSVSGILLVNFSPFAKSLLKTERPTKAMGLGSMVVGYLEHRKSPYLKLQKERNFAKLHTRAHECSCRSPPEFYVLGHKYEYCMESRKVAMIWGRTNGHALRVP